MPVTVRNKIGLVLAGLLALGDVVSVFAAPDGENGPPVVVVAMSVVLGLATLAALLPAWRTGDRTALRAVAGTRILSAILSLPAFFVDVPAGIKIGAAVAFALTAVCVVLVLTPSTDRVPVTD